MNFVIASKANTTFGMVMEEIHDTIVNDFDKGGFYYVLITLRLIFLLGIVYLYKKSH